MGHCTEITGKHPPDNFLPVLSAIVSGVSGSIKAGFQDIAGKMNAIAAKTSDTLLTNATVTEALMAQIKPYKKNSAFYIITGIVLFLSIIIIIIILKRKK
jgi:hypothetical protein